MKICGIKATHDGSIAVIDDGKLIFSVELEKINNNDRYSEIADNTIIADVLRQFGYAVGDIDHFVIDGWNGLETSSITVRNNGAPRTIPVAPYRETKPSEDILREYRLGSLDIGSHTVPYTSYMHVSGHVLGAYCCSPFAHRQEDAYVLVWDGGMFPRLYYFDAAQKKVENLGVLFYLIGNFYSEFSMYFTPFRPKTYVKNGLPNLSVAGKVMAYIAKGTVREEIIAIFNEIITDHLNINLDYVHEFAATYQALSRGKGFREEDVLASFHVFLERLLLEGLAKKCARDAGRRKNIVLAGGCFLNIKWNSSIRNSGIVDQVWVPPFPNDSGSAVGTACCAMIRHTGHYALRWDVYSGPDLAQAEAEAREGWMARSFSIPELARLLHVTNEPVVMLNGRAELGPRALGNRSMLAAATDPAMKALLNQVKNREAYRPVAPICLEEDAPAIFDPGTPDPLMLYDHKVREGWHEKVPAICHLDGTARLQTMNARDNALVYQLLSEYKELSGIPLLCNTSANHNGKGFFPDVASAMDWNKLNFIWSDGKLYYKKEYGVFVGSAAGYQETKVDENVVLDL